MMNVLFVCTGNTCRSPMAASLFAQICTQRGAADVGVDSAGLSASDKAAVTENARAVLAEHRVSLLRLRSQRLNGKHIRWADLVVVMTEHHREIVLARYAMAKGKTVKLLEFTSGGSLGDPYGGTLDDYEDCLAIMRPGLEALAERLT